MKKKYVRKQKQTKLLYSVDPLSNRFSFDLPLILTSTVKLRSSWCSVITSSAVVHVCGGTRIKLSTPHLISSSFVSSLPKSTECWLRMPPPISSISCGNLNVIPPVFYSVPKKKTYKLCEYLMSMIWIKFTFFSFREAFQKRKCARLSGDSFGFERIFLVQIGFICEIGFEQGLRVGHISDARFFVFRLVMFELNTFPIHCHIQVVEIVFALLFGFIGFPCPLYILFDNQVNIDDKLFRIFPVDWINSHVTITIGLMFAIFMVTVLNSSLNSSFYM